MKKPARTTAARTAPPHLATGPTPPASRHALAPADLTVQQWGNSLAVRIPAAMARAARVQLGQPVQMALHEDGLLLTRTGEVRTTLAQKLAAFDPDRHGGEAMATAPVGREVA